MVVTEVDDWTWWTSIGGDLADQVPDEVWDAALETAFDPSTQAVADDLIPEDEVFAEASQLAYADNSWSGDDAGFDGDDSGNTFEAGFVSSEDHGDDHGGDHGDHGDDGFVGL